MDFIVWLVDHASSGTAVLLFLGALGAALGFLYRKVWRPVGHKVERILQIADLQLTTNGGGSLLDKVNVIEERQVEIVEHQKDVAGSLVVHDNKIQNEFAHRDALMELRFDKIEEMHMEVHGSLDQRLSHIDEGHDALDSRLDHIDEIMSTVGADLGRRETAILNRLDRIEAHTATPNPQTAVNTASIAALTKAGKTTEAIKDDTAAIKEDTAAIKKSLEEGS